MTEELKEELRLANEEMIAEREKDKKEWEQVKESLFGQIHPKYFAFAESHTWCKSCGIVEIELTDKREYGYPSTQCCVIKGDTELFLHTTCHVDSFKDSIYQGHPIEYWVKQWTGYICDDYYGYLLMPLYDGIHYWKVNYNC